MNDIVKKVLDRGVPLDTPVIVNIMDLVDLFDKKNIIDDYKKCSKEIICSISNMLDVFCGNFALPVYATIYTKEDNHKSLIFSGENYFYTLSKLIEVDDIYQVLDIVENKEKFNKIKNQILAISDKKELKNRFPNICGLYEDNIESNQNFLLLDEMIHDKNYPRDEVLSNYGRISNNYKNFYPNFNMDKEIENAKNFSLQGFLSNTCDIIERMIYNADEIINLYSKYSLDLNSLPESDFEKLDLYIASLFMDSIEDENEVLKQRYLFYLTNYFKDNVEAKVTRVKIKLNGKKITPISLYERYKIILLKNPELKAINFNSSDFSDMSRSEIEEFIVAYLSELSANWELISPNDESIENEVCNSVRRMYRNLSEEERKQKQDKLLDLFIKKKTFFDSTDPYFRVRGKDTFDGYVGFIYSNSIVVLDKFYDNADKEKLSDGDAIYIMSMSDFYELSQHSKSYLIANHLCNRVIHKGYWQQRVLKYINKETKVTPVKETNKLIDEEKLKLKIIKNI